MSLIEVSGIDRDRIVDEHLVPDEYFCPICQYLLWKPRSCSSCQHLFCEKCIQIWIGNVNSANRCPFRCEPFEDRRCPPYVQSMLNRINIHCRNSSFGCDKVLSYNLLEQHENTECEHLTQQCFDCQKLVLVSKLNEHQQIPGLCIPYPIKCTICQNYISKSLFRDHFHQCCQMKTDQLMDQRYQDEILQTRTNDQLQPPINGMELIQNRIDTIQMYEHQRHMSRLPTTLKGVDEVRQKIAIQS
ncbi:unnamed protein product [Rotaria sordida]|uniref:RING-type domain-containing protein n=1 Tax=Rotaria sordida TaxID=392033 RepID=A0A819EZM2_9BILA|nr:unnamed protein product [Rotaria sordida]CAF3859159.1 unnamed protein product [Rotaria sordida]